MVAGTAVGISSISSGVFCLILNSFGSIDRLGARAWMSKGSISDETESEPVIVDHRVIPLSAEMLESIEPTEEIERWLRRE